MTEGDEKQTKEAQGYTADEAEGARWQWQKDKASEERQCGELLMNNWQPIETAPEDDTIVMLGWRNWTGTDNQDCNQEIAHYVSGKWEILGNPKLLISKYSYWMSIPYLSKPRVPKTTKEFASEILNKIFLVQADPLTNDDEIREMIEEIKKLCKEELVIED